MEHAATSMLVPPERLSWAEICRRYPDEWVMLTGFESPEEDSPDIASGVVVGHGRSRKAVWAASKTLEAGRDAGLTCVFTGPDRPLPDGAVLNLLLTR